MDAPAEAAFRAFVADRSPALMRTAYLLTQDQARAEDLLQEVLAGLARRWDRVREPEAYARRSLYRRQVSWWRHPGRAREVVTAVVPDRPVYDEGAAVDERLVVARALQRLTVRQRAVLTLRYLDDMPEGEIAALLGCTVGTVRSQVHRALQRIRKLAPELGELAHRQEVHR